MLLGYFQLLHSIRYIGYVGCSAFYFCCLFAFIAGSPFVYIDYFGIPPQYYGFLFGVNMLGMIASTYVNSRIVVQRGSDHLLRIACIIGALGGFALCLQGLPGGRHYWIGHPFIRGPIIADDGCFQCDFRGAFCLSSTCWRCRRPGGRHSVWLRRPG